MDIVAHPSFIVSAPKNADNIHKKLQTCHYFSTDMHFREESKFLFIFFYLRTDFQS